MEIPQKSVQFEEHVKVFFSNASQNTCLWHMIIHGINNRSQIKNERLKCVMKSWLWFIATNTEFDYEQKELLAHLKVRWIV